MEHIGTITEHSIEEGKKGDYHKITVEPEKWGYNVFDPTLFVLCKKDKHIKVTYEINGKYRDVKSIEEVLEVVPAQTETMSKSDWARKDRATWRCGIAKSFIEILGDDRDWTPKIEAAADRAFAWVIESSKLSKAMVATPATGAKVATPQPAAEEVAKKPNLGERKAKLQTDLYAQGYKNAAEIKQFLAEPTHGFEHTSVGQLNEAEVARLEELLAKVGKQEKLE